MTFILKKLAWNAFALWVVFTLSFLLVRNIPGGPFTSERKMTEAMERNFKERYGLNDPLFTQYVRELRKVLSGDLGLSFRLGDFSVNDVVAEGFPVSASLGILAITIAITCGISAGVYAASRRNTVYDTRTMLIAALGVAVPNFVLAVILLLVFSFWLRILPAGGWGKLSNLILPALCLAAPHAAYIARLTRTGMLEVLGLDYIRTAHAKGLSERTVLYTHALRGALLPVVTYLGPATAYVLTGTPVLERIFNVPGMGSHFVEAALQGDYTLSMGMIVVYTFLLLLMNALVDISYALIDPRVKME